MVAITSDTRSRFIVLRIIIFFVACSTAICFAAYIKKEETHSDGSNAYWNKKKRTHFIYNYKMHFTKIEMHFTRGEIIRLTGLLNSVFDVFCENNREDEKKGIHFFASVREHLDIV
jgi:predicted lipid-binding transport protein (Tim44 family)